MISTIALAIDRILRNCAKNVNVLLKNQTLDGCLLIALITTVTIITFQTSMGMFGPYEYVRCKPDLRIDHLCLGRSFIEPVERTIYVVTPTYDRYVQIADLTRLSNTLILVPKLHWIIVEDSNHKTTNVEKFILRLEGEFAFHSATHLYTSTPPQYKLKPGQPTWVYPKGIWQRNRALEWLINNRDELDQDGIIYFADDDNTYDLKLFAEIRETRMISVWPVAFAGGLLVEKPIVDRTNRSKVVAFNSEWRKDRPYPIDMAGFAISLKLYFSKHNVKFSAKGPIGFIESNFIGKLINSWDELEPRSNECRDVLVWHTQTKQPNLHEEKRLNNTSMTEVK